ncbi:MAG: leucine-rich repeat protein [Prevotella sp.]|nr:leucine-rich repeat protein [Prevotella sp.]
MKIKNLIAVAALLLGSTSAFAQTETASGIFKISVTAGNATIKGFKADTPASEQVNVTVPATLANDGGDDFNVIAIGANAFDGNTNLKTINIAASVATIDASAFNDCSQLTTVTFAENSELATLGAKAFGDTPGLTKISFANCAKMKDFSGADPFVNASGLNYYLKEVEFNAATTDIGTALAGLKALTTVNLGATAITALAAGSLANTDALATLVLPATCNDIDATGATALTSLTINAEDVDFSAAEASAAPAFTMSNAANSTITFGNIDGATFSDPATAYTIAGPTALGKTTTLTLGNVASDLDYAIVSGNVLSATIGDLAAGADVSSDVFSGAVTININTIANTATIAAGTVANATTTTLNFNAGKTITGAGAIAAGAFKKFTKLATVNINATVATAKAFADASFGDDTDMAGSAADAVLGIKLTVNYKPATYIGAFGNKAFKATTTTTKDVKLATNRVFILGATFATDYGANGANFFRVTIDAPAEEVIIEVAKKDGKYWYGKYFNEGSMLKIAKEQNGDKVMVYGAYVDQDDNTIYMDQLHVIKGYYFVPANCPVIVKSNTADPVKAVATETGDVYPTYGSMNLSGATTYQNEICRNDDTHNTGAKVQNEAADKDWSDATGTATVDNNDFAIFFLYPAASFNFYWNSIQATATAPEGEFYIRVNKSLIAAGGRVNIVWNDGSEEATAIQTVKKVAEANGTIYNLAGQKVNASYKGVVIKDGKKYIQK